MAEAARKMATYEDLIAGPEHIVAGIIHGQRPDTAPLPGWGSISVALMVGAVQPASGEQALGDTDVLRPNIGPAVIQPT